MINIETNCTGCNRTFIYDLPKIRECYSRKEIKDLKEKNAELENNLSEKEIVLIDANKEIENLKKKLEELEINSKEFEVVQTEIVECSKSKKSFEERAPLNLAISKWTNSSRKVVSFNN